MAPTIRLQYPVIDGYVRHPMFPELFRKKNEAGLYLETNGNLHYIGRRLRTVYGGIINEFLFPTSIATLNVSTKYRNAMWEYSDDDPPPPLPTDEEIMEDWLPVSHLDD